MVGECALACFNCANCKDGKLPSACLNMREVGFRPDSPGGMGEYLILEEAYLHVIPDDWTMSLAPGLRRSMSGMAACGIMAAIPMHPMR